MTHILDWHGPYSWATSAGLPCVTDPAAPAVHLPGVYLWTVPSAAGNRIYYVGKTDRTLCRRLKEERDLFLNGQEYIPDPLLLVQGRKEFLYVPRYPKKKNPPEFLERRDLPLQIDRLLHLFQLYIAPFEDGNDLRRRAEAALMWDVWDAGSPAWDIIAINDPWPLRKRGIKIPMKFPTRLLGLFDSLDA